MDNQNALIISFLSILIAVVSLAVSFLGARAAQKQADQAESAVLLSVQISKSEAISHFTDRFFDLLKDKGDHSIEEKLIRDPGWAYQFWSLQSTEFYFFHHRVIPLFMYTLWMVDLAAMYVGAKGEQIRQSHQAYLDKYSLNYDEMCGFFDEMYKKAKNQSDVKIRNKAIAAWMEDWFKAHQRESFDGLN